jgi:hypothetical protein
LVASIEFVGNYSAGNFHITSGRGGIVEITDPTIPNGGSIDARTADASALHSGIDLPNIASARRRRSPTPRATPRPGAR